MCEFFQNITEHAFCFTAGSTNLLKYRALYEFVARNSDELSFQPGDVIMVSSVYSLCFVMRVTCSGGLLFSFCLSCPAVKAFDFQDNNIFTCFLCSRCNRLWAYDLCILFAQGVMAKEYISELEPKSYHP